MIEFFVQLARRMPPLRKKRNPNVAALIGVLFGPLGLGVYFGSFGEFCAGLLLTTSALLLAGQLGDTGELGIVLVWASGGLWGYFRVIESNEQLESSPDEEPEPGGEWWEGTGPSASPTPPPVPPPPAESAEPAEPADGWWEQEEEVVPPATAAPPGGDAGPGWWTATGPAASGPEAGPEWWRGDQEAPR